MSNVNFIRDDYTKALPDWRLVEVICEGQRAMHDAGEKYLPDPNMVHSGSTEKKAVYAAYLQRAAFFGVTGQTLQTMTGIAFKDWPTLTVPTGIDYVSDDIDGAGLSIYQQSQSALAEGLKKGRCALWVDYPATETPASKAQQLAGLVRANCLLIKSEQIINWRTQQVGGKQMLSLVVIADTRTVEDGYGQKSEEIIRVLKLDAGVYVVELWVRVDDVWTIEDVHIPKDGAGATWKSIPFFLIGAQDNGPAISKAPLLDMANLNVKHYQVSADWYNALFYAGQPQPVMTGLTEAWRNHLEESGVVLGSRAPLLLPVGGAFEFATVPADAALSTELDKLEKRMQAIGAKLITPGEVVKTATQAAAENTAQHSVLSLLAQNVSEAYGMALQSMCQYMRVTGDCVYQLSTTYVDAVIDAQLLQVLVAANQAGKLPDADFYALLRKMSVIDPEKTDEQIAEELANQSGGLALNGQ